MIATTTTIKLAENETTASHAPADPSKAPDVQAHPHGVRISPHQERLSMPSLRPTPPLSPAAPSKAARTWSRSQAVWIPYRAATVVLGPSSAPPQAGRRAGTAFRASRESPRPPRDALPEIELRRSGVHHGSPKSAHPRPLPPRCCPENGPEPLLHREQPTGRRASCRTCNQNQAPASATPSPSTPPQGTENPPGPF